MRTKSLSLLITMTLIYAAMRYERQASAAKADESLTSSRRPAVSADSANDGRVIVNVSLSGSAPADPVINMSADPLCSKLHPKPAVTEDIIVGPENALANVLVYISDGLANRSFDPPQQPLVLDQKGCMYHPHVLALMAGQKLVVENNDPTTHNIHPIPANNREWNQSQAQGVPPIEATFGREEIAIPVKCNIHPWMKGYIAVFKHPYFGITARDGTFVLKDLPPGSYTITAWQEKLGTLTQKVTVAANQVSEARFVFGAHGLR